MKVGPMSPLKLKLLTAAVLASTFGLGAIAGAGVFRWVVAERLASARDLARGPLPLQELDLSDEQDAQVREIFERHRPSLDAVLRESFPRVRVVHEQIEAEIRSILTAEQRTKFDRLKESRPFPPPEMPSRPGGLPPGGPPPLPRPPFPPPDRP